MNVKPLLIMLLNEFSRSDYSFKFFMLLNQFGIIVISAQVPSVLIFPPRFSLETQFEEGLYLSFFLTHCQFPCFPNPC